MVDRSTFDALVIQRSGWMGASGNISGTNIAVLSATTLPCGPRKMRGMAKTAANTIAIQRMAAVYG